MEIIFIAILALIASIVGTITGFGTSTIMVPVLLFFFPVSQVLLLVGIIHWFGNIWKITLFRGGIRWNLLLLFGLSGIVLSYVGASLSLSIQASVLSRILGCFLLLYVFFLMLRPNFKIPRKNIVSISGGALSGFFAGIFGVGGAVRGVFLSAFDLPKAVYIATAGAIGLVIDTTRLTTYLVGGTKLDVYLLYGLLVFIPASFLGARIAKRIVNKIPQKKFRLVIAVFLFLVGVKLIFFS